MVESSTDEIEELRAKEKELGIEPDWEIDAFMKASSLKGKEHSIMTDYILRMLGLEVSVSHLYWCFYYHE